MKQHAWPRGFFFAVLSLLAGAIPLRAETAGEIRGRIIDEAGAPLPGMTVLVESRKAGISDRGALTDAAGAFRVPALPPASDYRVKASGPARTMVVISEVEVVVGRPTALTITLPTESALREQVKVRATPPVVNPEETSTTTRFSSEFVDSLPILGRDYQDVLVLAPGVTDVDGDGNPNIHGARDTDTLTVVDGVTTTDPLTGKMGAQLNIESIQEIEVKTTGASAEFGRAQGGTVNILTKSGGNDFAGSFKFYWRGSRLDGDGAGEDDPRLHGGLGDIGLRDLTFNDYLPFLSMGGPLVRDRAWYYMTFEYISKQDPINALTTAFVTGIREWRQFGKFTWQVTPSQRVALSVNHDPQQFLNQGLNSLTAEETGFTIGAGGILLTLRDTAVLSPTVALEGTIGWFEGQPNFVPNLGPDTNENGVLFTPRNGDTFDSAFERDSGEDYDGDGRFDVFEDYIANGRLDYQEACIYYDRHLQHNVNGCPPDGASPPVVFDEDFDHDRRLTPPGGCEGLTREDQDCDGHLDRINEDRNHNGRLDTGEDLDGDGRLDLGTEDRNNNKELDDDPFPTTTYPYGHLKPYASDRDYTVDLMRGTVSGPYFESYDDERTRGTVRADLTLFATGFGTHDLKTGFLLEREGFHRVTDANDIVGLRDPGFVTGLAVDQVNNPGTTVACNPYETTCTDPGLGRITVSLPIEREVSQEASGLSAGTYVQDLWHPRPNLSVMVGLRFDRETANSDGYTSFDPRVERARFNRLSALAGGERGKDPVRGGNGDGMVSLGITADPLLGGDDVKTWVNNTYLDPLNRAGLTQFTMHRSTIDFQAPILSALFPGIFAPGGHVDPDVLRQLGVPVQEAEAFTITNNNLSPRLAISWDPTSDGRSKIFASWGRYYDKLFLSSVVGEQGIERLVRYYVLDRDGLAAPTTAHGVPLPDHNIGTLLSKAPPSVTQVDRQLQTPFSDELTLGVERELSPDLGLAVRYIHRQFRAQLQDLDINHQTRINPLTGRPLDEIGALATVPSQFPQEPPSYNRVPDGRPDLFIDDPFFNQILRVGNYNDARYTAFELELRRRLSRRWELTGSYTYSRATGQAEDFQSQLGNDPSMVELEDGYLSFDQRHVVKLNGIAFLPHDWQLGGATTWSSGLPYSLISRFYSLDDADYQQFRTLFGSVVPADKGAVFVPERRNSRRNGAVLDVNARVSKNMVIGRTTAGVSFEVFNLLNRDELIISSIDPSRNAGFQPNGAATYGGPLQLDATRRFGRRWQIGFQIAF
ncbi:MAG TPA: carboxypeptidase regulatory-like domain-containing protein [Patescibacteria group bacterium]|nr:carboxypeptidase regulatory-like domain-containing protein [Patescibacteria group bacterium]